MAHTLLFFKTEDVAVTADKILSAAAHHPLVAGKAAVAIMDQYRMGVESPFFFVYGVHVMDESIDHDDVVVVIEDAIADENDELAVRRLKNKFDAALKIVGEIITSSRQMGNVDVVGDRLMCLIKDGGAELKERFSEIKRQNLAVIE